MAAALARSLLCRSPLAVAQRLASCSASHTGAPAAAAHRRGDRMSSSGAAAAGAAAGAATAPPVPQANLALADSEVLLATTFDSVDRWAAYLEGAGVRVRVYRPEEHHLETGDLSQVEFAIAWNPPAGLLAQCPKLRAIQSMGAGVDSMLGEPSLPRHVPLLRVIDPLMSQRMATWVLWGVINVQRRCDAYLEAQRDGRWDKGIEDFRNVDNSELRVGVMGLGVMGGAVADTLRALGYPVSAWTRTLRSPAPEGIACYHGAEQLQAFASAVDVLVCLLPLTDATRGILDARLFSWLPPGAAVINAARGGHCVDADLLAALDSGHLSSAILDVFSPEPLPTSSRLWSHPKVRVFPHVSSMTNIESAAAQMLANRECILTGKAPPPELVVDWEAGY